MRLNSLVVAAAALLGGQAYALDPATMNAAATLKVYVAGSPSLSANTINRFFTDDCIASTRTDYQLPEDVGFGTIYTCRLRYGSVLLPEGGNVMFQKRDARGWPEAVYSVANNTPTSFINPWTCVGPASGVGTCTTRFMRTADGSVSDVEPALFAAAANTPWYLAGVRLDANFTSQQIHQKVYGLAVTATLYQKLQADQGLAATVRPSVPQAVIGQMLRSGFAHDFIGWKLLLPNTVDGTQNSQVTICSGAKGSGEQAAANRFFLEYPFNSGATIEPLSAGDSTVASHGTTAGQLYVTEGPGAADTRGCMFNANAANGFAIGHMSRENPEEGSWKFVKIGGQEPSRDAAKAGHYAYFFGVHGQASTRVPYQIRMYLSRLFEKAGHPYYLSDQAIAVQFGVMANPDICPAPFGSGDANQRKFCSRVWRSNAASFPEFFR